MPRVQVPVFPCDFGARFCPQGISSASRGFGWRIHCGVEVTELSTNKQLSLTELRLLLLCISLSVSLRLSLLHGTSFADVPDVCVCVCTHTHTDTHRHTQTDTDRHTHTQTHRNLLCRRSWIPERVTCFQHQQRVLDNCSANLHSLTHFPSLPTAEIAAGGLRHRSRNMCASMACVVHLHQRYEHLPRAPPGRPASTRRPPRGTPCICSFRAGAGRCSPPRTPCMCSFRAGAGRCSPPRTPCMCSFRAGAGRCSPPSTPCMCSFGASAGRCSPPRTPCMCSSVAGAGRCSPPRTPCICPFGAGAGRCSPPPHSLHWLLRRWCGQTCAASFARRLTLCRPLREPPSLAHAGCRRLYTRGALVACSRGERGHQRECGSGHDVFYSLVSIRGA
jgi:hypothetical protein